MAQLNRQLGLFGLTMIAVGSCIGAGIFVTPAKIAEATSNHLLILLAWGLGGVIALTGALTFSELGSMFPKAGGVYIYLKEAYGDLVGFLYGWVILLVVNTGALAALALAFAEYVTFFFPVSEMGKIAIATMTIVSLTIINILGINISELFAKIFTGLKLLAIFGVVVVAFYCYEPARVNLDFSLASAPDNIAQAMLVALIGVLWSMGGWHHASYLAGEAVNPRKTVPRAMIFGVLVVTITYMLVNLAYMLLLPLDQIMGTERIAGDALEAVMSNGGRFMAVIIAISIFGTIGIYTMSAPRVYFAMAKEGIFFSKLTYLHPRYKTPVVAMAVQASWAIVLLFFWGTFHDLITYVTFMDIVFMMLAGISVFIFRVKRKEMDRPVKVPLYPIIPLLFVLISFAFLVSTFFEKPQQVWWGLGILALGIPLFYYFKRGKERG